MDALLKSKDDKVSRDASSWEVLILRRVCGIFGLWSKGIATVMLAGSRPYGRPQGLVQAFPPSHFSSLLIRGFTDA